MTREREKGWDSVSYLCVYMYVCVPRDSWETWSHMVYMPMYTALIVGLQRHHTCCMYISVHLHMYTPPCDFYQGLSVQALWIVCAGCIWQLIIIYHLHILSITLCLVHLYLLCSWKRLCPQAMAACVCVHACVCMIGGYDTEHVLLHKLRISLCAFIC